MPSNHKKKIENKPIKKVYYGMLVFFGLIALVALLSVAYALVYQDKVLLNSYLLGKNISGYNRAKLNAFIDQSESSYSDKKIKVVLKDKDWQINYSDFNWLIEKDKTSELILNYGHSGDFWKMYSETLKSIFFKQKYDLINDFNEAALLDWVNQINAEVGRPKEETNIILKGSIVKIIEAKQGEKIDEGKLRNQILDRLALKDKGTINLEIIKDDPVISSAEAADLVEKAKELTANPVKIEGPKSEIELTANELGTMIELKKKLKKTGFLKTEPQDAYVSFSSKKIKQFLQKNLDELNFPAQDAKFSISSGVITLTSPSKTGQKIKLDESVNLIIDALEKNEKQIKLPSQTENPGVAAQTSADIEKIGIKEIIGSATTDFKKSPENRVHNIQTGVKYISGAILKPGEEFSTISRLGKIDQSGGYLPELVIKENATVPEFGGGLCQVSTTLFRAAMNSGLKITERQNHSYRVSYYEPPVGMDATIYYPRPDLKFENTTDNFILINSYIEGTKITFDIYGTKDGRSVLISQPDVYDVTSPPESIYTDDPTLAPGEIKQIDSAHPGAKASFSYTVTKNGKVINQQTFNSYYVAWPSKFLRGPQSTESE